MRRERTVDTRTFLLSEILASVARANASGAALDAGAAAATIFAGVSHSPLDLSEIEEQIADLARRRGVALVSR